MVRAERAVVMCELIGLSRTWKRKDVEKANPYYTTKSQELAISGFRHNGSDAGRDARFQPRHVFELALAPAAPPPDRLWRRRAARARHQRVLPLDAGDYSWSFRSRARRSGPRGGPEIRQRRCR